MKKFSRLLVCCIFCIGTTQVFASSQDLGVHTPGPSYPAVALKANVTGSGLCEVTFDASGHVGDAVMTKRTGSKLLDDNTLNFARKNWTGHPNTKVTVPIVYQLAPSTKNLKGVPHLNTPLPPYPYQARAGGLQGRGVAKVSFDETGKAISVTMAKSTGSDILDKNTVAFGLANWRSSLGKKTTVYVPVAYLLR